MSPRRLEFALEAWPIKGSFRIARGAKTQAHVIVVEITGQNVRGRGAKGRGECVPYARYGETPESVLAALESLRPAIEGGLSREELQNLQPAGAARNALDCALLDWEAKQSGRPAHAIIGLPAPRPVRTAYTLSLDAPAAMGLAAGIATTKGYGLLKLKLGGADDLHRVRAVRQAAPQARLIVDANEGWTEAELTLLTPELARLGVSLIEQPLPGAGRDGLLTDFKSPVPLCADESCHTRADLPRVLGRYSHVNVKLDKAGGLTEAVALARAAKGLGLGLMVGCMVSTSLAMAPAMLLAGMAEIADLDGPLLLERDREPSMRYEGGLLQPAPVDLWGSESGP